jgi:predicted dehydrogenase/nucleoside-diphosphate-sugar epimerase
MTRICLVGAGFISHVHAEALRGLPGRGVTAVVDPDQAAAEKLAAGCGARAFTSVDAALAADAFDRAHVLVPPDLHEAVAVPLLRAGKPVLLEKPMATSPAEAATLLAASEAGALLGVNQNFIHHPAYARLRALVAARALGRPRHVACTYNMPLRQLAARQFGHWMFRAPGNILLEQAVHPLSQIAGLAGPIGGVTAQAGPPIELAPGARFYPALDATLACRDLPAQLRFAVGCPFPFWQLTVVCDDGVIVADIAANRCFTYGSTRWIEALDGALSGIRTGAAIGWAGLRNLALYAAGTAKLSRTGTPFLRSMRGSIAAFHDAADAGRAPELDGRFGANLVETCAALAAAAYAPPSPKPAAAPREAAPCDVAVLGGTGFIGTAVVARMLKAGLRVAVMARNLGQLPALFADPGVVLHRGSIGDEAAVARAIAGCKVVVNLAHGGASGGWEEVRRAMLGGAETVAAACQAAGVRRLVHVGSIASLYLGPQAAPVTGATPPDPHEAQRGDYARAKVLCDRMLLARHARDGLPVVILRPGVVVGEGTSPFHSGLGLFNSERHCIGWNAGRNPLPFVLVEDVAEAILLACDAPGIDGRCYNLVGDVRPDARSYIARLAATLQRPLRFHPQSPTWLWLEDYGKWIVKRLTGRNVPPPSRRDFLSRGMRAGFDCDDARRDLDWHPEREAARFWQRAVDVHAG